MTGSLGTGPRRPALFPRQVGAALLLLGLGLLARSAWVDTGARLAPPLVLLGVVGTLGAVAINFALGHVICLVAVGIQLAYWAAHPSGLPAELALRSNVLGLTCVMQLFVVGYQLTVRFLARRVRAQQQRIEERLAERSELTRALNVELSASVEALAHGLDAPRPDLSVLGAAQDQLQQALSRARGLLLAKHEPELTVDNVLPDFRRRMTRVLLIISLCNLTALLLRVLVQGLGSVLPTVSVLLITLAALLVTERWPARRPLVLVLLTLTTLLAMGASFAYWGTRVPPPNVVFLVPLAYNGVLMDDRRAPWLILAFGFLVQAGLIAAGVAATSWGAELMAWVALWMLLHQLGWHLLETRVHTALAAAQERAHELKLLDAFRTRISGTLFHDVANPAQVIGMLLEMSNARGHLSDVERDALLRFHIRLQALVRATFELLEHGDVLLRERIAETHVFGMFIELRELFQFRLAQKAQTLRTQGDEKLRVMTIPELLRDSVLANLLSNAIKFSPQGATIQLSAARVEGDAEIVVRDQGPGWPAELLRKLAEGKRPESTQGTAGEQGLGLGLTLAAEHARRLGGSLSLRSLPDGGGEAAVRVPAASGGT